MRKVIRLKKEHELDYYDAQGERFVLKMKAGSEVLYERRDTIGWREHWIKTRAKPKGSLSQVWFSKVVYEMKSPVLYAGKDKAPRKGTEVVVDGTRLGTFVEVVTTNDYTKTKMFKVWCPSLAAHSYSLTVQVPAKVKVKK
jgi:hypothetical protein